MIKELLKTKNVLSGIGVLTLVMLLGACNSEQTLQNDWVQNPQPTATTSGTPKPDPTPSATPSPTPTPTASGSELYSGSPEFAKYVMKFVDDAKIQGVDVLPDMTNPKLSIQLGSLDAWGSSVIGLCETSGSLRRVTFDPQFWNVVSETQRELLAHHELGHCILYRGHLSALLSTGAYASIMYPIIMSSSTYLNNYNYYQQELFSTASAAGFFRAIGTEKTTTHVCGLEDL